MTRRYVPGDFRGRVPPEEFDRFLEYLRREFGGPKPEPPPFVLPERKDRGDGQFGVEAPDQGQSAGDDR